MRVLLTFPSVQFPLPLSGGGYGEGPSVAQMSDAPHIRRAPAITKNGPILTSPCLKDLCITIPLDALNCLSLRERSRCVLASRLRAPASSSMPSAQHPLRASFCVILSEAKNLDGHSGVRRQQCEALLSRDLCITRSPSSLILTSPCPRREPALSFAEGSARFLSRRERFNASHLVMFVNAIS